MNHTGNHCIRYSTNRQQMYKNGISKMLL